MCSNADGSSTSKGSYLYAERSGRAAIRALCKLGLFIDYGRIITGIFAAQQVSLVVNLRAGSQKGCQSAGHITTAHPLSTQRSIVINQSPPTTTNWSNRSHLTKFVHLCLLHNMRWLACHPNTRCSSELLSAGSEMPPDECMPWHAMGQRSRLPRCQPAGDVLTTALQLLWSPFWQLAVVYLNSGILVPRYPSLWPKQEWACRSRSSPIAL